MESMQSYRRIIAREWLYFFSSFIVGTIFASIIMYGITTYHYETKQIRDSASTPPKDSLANVANTREEIRSIPKDEMKASRTNIRKKPRWEEDPIVAQPLPKGFELEQPTHFDPSTAKPLLENIIWNNEPQTVTEKVTDFGYVVFWVRIFDTRYRTQQWRLSLIPYIALIFLRITYWSLKTVRSKRTD